MTYIWKVINLNTSDQPRVLTVKSVDWLLVLERGEHRVSTWGRVYLSVPGVNFIEFNNLDQDTVVGWILDNLGRGIGRNARSYQEILKDLDQQMDQVEFPHSKSRVPPWVSG